jgi:hypothetical protein
VGFGLILVSLTLVLGIVPSAPRAMARRAEAWARGSAS